MSLATGKVIMRRVWTKLPTSQTVIDRVHAMAKEQPSMPVFTNQSGHPIRDMTPDFVEEDDPANVEELPGVEILDDKVWHEITGVDRAQNVIPHAIAEPGVHFDLGQPPREEAPILETTKPTPQSESDIVLVEPVGQPVRRSSCQRMAIKNYAPSMQGKKYSFATTQLGCKLLDNVQHWHDPRVVLCFMEQLSAKVVLKKSGKDAEAAGEKMPASFIGESPLFPSFTCSSLRSSK